jgi:hypothetical protein
VVLWRGLLFESLLIAAIRLALSVRVLNLLGVVE